MKRFAPIPALRKRHKTTRKWPINKALYFSPSPPLSQPKITQGSTQIAISIAKELYNTIFCCTLSPLSDHSYMKRQNNEIFLFFTYSIQCEMCILNTFVFHFFTFSVFTVYSFYFFTFYSPWCHTRPFFSFCPAVITSSYDRTVKTIPTSMPISKCSCPINVNVRFYTRDAFWA